MQKFVKPLIYTSQKSFFANQDGFVLPFMAMVLPAMILIGVLIIDGGRLYIRQAQLQHLSRQAAYSGILAFSNMLEDRATSNYQATCNTEFPPEICNSTNKFDFLSQTEIVSLIGSGSTQTVVTNAVKDFATSHDPELTFESADLSLTFPYQYEGSNEVKLLVNIEDTVSGFFEDFLTSARTVSVESQVFLSLN